MEDLVERLDDEEAARARVTSPEEARELADQDLLARVQAGDPDDPFSALSEEDLAALSPDERALLARWYLRSNPVNESWKGVIYAGDPRDHLEGLGLDAWDGFPDLKALSRDLLYTLPDGSRSETRTKIPVGLRLPDIAPRVIKRSYIEPRAEPTVRIKRQQERAERNREALINHIAQGYSVADALAILDISMSQYRQWRSRYEGFRDRVDAARKDRRLEMQLTHLSDADERDFVMWRRYFTGYKSYAHHRKIIEAIEAAPPGQMTMILVPPEAGKTTLLEDYITWLTCLNPNHRALVVSEASTHAEKILASIKERMEVPSDVDLLTSQTEQPSRYVEMVARYGPFHDEVEDRSKPWNAQYVKVSKAVGHRDFTIQAVGWNKKVYGARCDLLLLDDMQSAVSLNLTEQMMIRLQRTFFSRPGKDGKIVYIGTRVGLGDLPETLIKQGVVSNLVIIPALDDEGNSYCPEMWPVSSLIGDLDPETGKRVGGKKQLVGEDGWWCTYMQRPEQAGQGVFKEEELVACEDRSIMIWDRPAFSASDPWVVGMSVDPALGGGCGFFSGAYSRDKMRMISAEVRPGLARNEDIFAVIKEHMVRTRGTFLVVERNALQRGIARDQRLRDMGRDMGFEIIEHETGNNKWDPAFGVRAMVSTVAGERLIIPGAPGAREHLEDWYAQMISWRPGIPPKLLTQDLVMATWFFWMHWQKEVEVMDVDLDAWEVAGTPWRPGDTSGRWGGNQNQGWGYLRTPVGVR